MKRFLLFLTFAFVFFAACEPLKVVEVDYFTVDFREQEYGVRFEPNYDERELFIHFENNDGTSVQEGQVGGIYFERFTMITGKIVAVDESYEVLTEEGEAGERYLLVEYDGRSLGFDGDDDLAWYGDLENFYLDVFNLFFQEVEV